jgi:3-hydroxybutyryl-CoA dehydrogenase
MRFLCKKLLMQLVILADENLREELLSNESYKEANIIWIENAKEFIQYKKADGFIDLLFDDTIQRVELLKKISSKPVIINSVATTLKEINAPFIRMNAWPGFLKRPLLEASSADENIKEQAEKIFSLLNNRLEWVADNPGFITARVIAMIINEAYFALEEEVSTKEEIDTAMKLGTNYPYGPFEWAKKIDLKNIHRLLNKLCKINPRYQPAELLKKEAAL